MNKCTSNLTSGFIRLEVDVLCVRQLIGVLASTQGA